MIDNQQAAIFKSNQDFNKNKEKILQYIKYVENWQVASVMCSYTVVISTVFESKDKPTQMTKPSFTIVDFITYRKSIHFELICKDVHN